MTSPASTTWGAAPSGYRRTAVSDPNLVEPGRRLLVTANVAGFTVREPVEVVSVVDSSRRAGFSYRTLPGHPVRGEESFVVHRDGDAVLLTIRSLTRAAPSGMWRAVYPALLVAQRVAHFRYARALR